MKTAAEQATAQHADSGLTIDPSELKRLRQAARVRPSASEAREGLLAAAERQAGRLPERLVRAQASRAKETDISGGETRPVEITEQPEALLAATTDAIEHAKFVGKADKPMVQQLLAELEWIMKTAAEQATAQHAASGLTVDPSRLRWLKRAARLRARAGASEAREGLLAGDGVDGEGDGRGAQQGADPIQ